MGIMISCLVMMFGTFAAILGVSFYARNIRYSATISTHILFYGLFAALWCHCYGLIGVTEDMILCGYIRMVGIFAIDAFLLNEGFFVCKMTKLSKPVDAAVKTVLTLLSAVDLIFYGNTGLDIFVRVGSWTTWYVNDQYAFNRLIHVTYMLLIFIVMFVLAMLWYLRNRLLRQRKFISILIVANFLLVLFSLPDTFLPMFGKPALSTSGIGAALCTAVVWYGGTRLNYFDIRMGNIAGKIIDFINVGVIVFDTEKKAVIINNFAKGLLVTDKYTGGGIKEYFKLDEVDEISLYENAMKEGMFSERLKGRTNGSTYQVRMSAINDDFGDPFCYVCVFADVTEEMKMIDRLEVASMAKSSFLAQMSHEIRTPIHAILGMNEMIERESTENNILEYSSNIDSAGHTLLSLINTILDFSKIEDGKMEIIPVVYDTASFINDLVNSILQLAQDKGLEFEVHTDDSIPCALMGDDLRLSQVIMNLLTNAVKYTEKGSVTLTFRYEGRLDDTAMIYVAVEDTGVGIRQEDIDRVFESFERLDEMNNRNIEGTGLGISIVKDILRLMDSRLEVKSTYGKGSRFFFTIKQKIADASPIGNYEDRLKESEKKGAGREVIYAPAAKVLVVDDNDMNLKVLDKLLGLCGIKPDLVSGGEDAIERMKEKTYDVVFLDHMMPKMDGMETFRRLKEQDLIPEKTAMIMLTANAISGSREKYLGAGLTDYLSKPIPLERLSETLDKYLPEELMEKREILREEEDRGDLPSIEGIDWEKAFRNMPDRKLMKEIFKTFTETAGKDAQLLNDAYEKGVLKTNDREQKSLYRVKVHAMKNSAAQIGAGELSGKAKALEYAIREDKVVYIRENHESFISRYLDMAERIKEAMFWEDGSSDSSMSDGTLLENMELVKKAVSEFDAMKLNEISHTLDTSTFSSSEITQLTGELVEAIREFDTVRIEELARMIEEKLKK